MGYYLEMVKNIAAMEREVKGLRESEDELCRKLDEKDREIERIYAEYEALLKDKARLDWMEADTEGEPRISRIANAWWRGAGVTIRACIDAAKGEE